MALKLNFKNYTDNGFHRQFISDYDFNQLFVLRQSGRLYYYFKYFGNSQFICVILNGISGVSPVQVLFF